MFGPLLAYYFRLPVNGSSKSNVSCSDISSSLSCFPKSKDLSSKSIKLRFVPKSFNSINLLESIFRIETSSILYFFCGVTFPISLFLPWISNLSSIFPLTLGIYLLRNSLQAGINTWSNIGTGILVSLAILIFANIFIAKFEDMMIN